MAGKNQGFGNRQSFQNYRGEKQPPPVPEGGTYGDKPPVTYDANGVPIAPPTNQGPLPGIPQGTPPWEMWQDQMGPLKAAMIGNGATPGAGFSPGYSPTPGTPGIPGYQMPNDAGALPPPMPGMGSTQPGAMQLMAMQMGGVVPPGAGVASPGGMFNTPFTQSITGDALSGMMADPAAFYSGYMNFSGMPQDSGNYAMGAPYAQNMPIEFMMTPDAQGLNVDPMNEAAFYEQNIQDGMTPGTGYYTTGQFVEQAFTPGSAMNQYIFGQYEQGPGGTMVEVSPDKQFANFLNAMEAVLGATMSPDMLNHVATQYAQAYQQYQQLAMTGQATMSLEQWLLQYGLGPQQGQ